MLEQAGQHVCAVSSTKGNSSSYPYFPQLTNYPTKNRRSSNGSTQIGTTETGGQIWAEQSSLELLSAAREKAWIWHKCWVQALQSLPPCLPCMHPAFPHPKMPSLHFHPKTFVLAMISHHILLAMNWFIVNWAMVSIKKPEFSLSAMQIFSWDFHFVKRQIKLKTRTILLKMKACQFHFL